MIDKTWQEHLKSAVAQESARFEEFYLWLKSSMPSLFFEEVAEDWVSLIVHALTAFKLQDFFSEIHFKNAAISLCIDAPDADIKILKSYPMYGIKNYTTYISQATLPFPEAKGCLRIAIINFTEAIESKAAPLEAKQKKELSDFLQARSPHWSKEKCHTLIDAIDPAFLRKMPTERRLLVIEMFERAQTSDHCQYEVQYEEQWNKKELPSVRLVLAWKNTPKHNFLYRLARVVFRHNLVIRRVVATYQEPYSTQNILMLSMGLHGREGKPAWEEADIADFLQEIVTLKYFGSFDSIDQVFVKPKLIRGNLGNFLRASVNFIHQVLVQVDPNLYSLEHIHEDICRHPELTVMLCKAFEYKFHPEHVNFDKFVGLQKIFIELVSQLDTGQEGLDQRRKNILLQAMNFVSHILRTNFYRNNKTALAFRLNPLYLEHAPFERKKIFPELPYSVFYVKGMHFLGFHIRFKDLARGGLRTIYPNRKEKVLSMRNTVFTECYNLAYTQHKKNKDIPEGGAKGIIFLKPYARLDSETEILRRELRNSGMTKEQIDESILQFIDEQRLEYLYQTQRSFIKAFTSILNCNPDGSLRTKRIVDYLNKPEYIYLGPDENMHDSMIQWIAQESTKVNYKPKGAFISGKPTLGINHKEFGVTSLGLNVCMHEVLKFLKIDPYNNPFTVKMTGGPDGDVAGNQIYNLHRYYPKTAKLLALTDVSGTIYDPKGLDLETLVELFRNHQPIRFYPQDKLSEGAFLLDREKRREPTPYSQQTLCWRNRGGTIVADWLSGNEMNALYRNNVHNTIADIFIPCGGRPKTLRDNSYKQFLDKDGTPTSKAIIEGANLYLSTWARHYFEKLGVLIVKDSSANKGGVICSSFEILCGLCLTDEEFLKYKHMFTQEILDRLKQMSMDEVTLLLKTHQETDLPLSQISDEISSRINFFTDQLLEHLESVQLGTNSKDPLINCFLHYCPKTLKERFEGALLQEIPDNHKKAIIASHIASRLVYKRGLKWFPSVVDILPLIIEQKEILY